MKLVNGEIVTGMAVKLMRTVQYDSYGGGAVGLKVLSLHSFGWKLSMYN